MALTGSWDNTARLWDALTGEPLGEPMRHESAVFTVTFSPDGSMVLTRSEDETVRLWDAATGKPLCEPMHVDNSVSAVAFSPDSHTLLMGSYDNTARLWKIPQIPDHPELVRVWAATKTGLALDGQGLVRHLSKAELLKARDDLEKLRGNLELP
jgi:WD40 repeat protein